MLDVEQRSGVTLVRLRHGKVNALDLELLQAITVAMRGADENAAVVITGSGTAFSAGLGAFMAIFDHPGPVLAAIRPGRSGWSMTSRCRTPLLDSVIRRAQTMAQVPADVFSLTKRQLQQPARDRIAARSGDAETILAT